MKLITTPANPFGRMIRIIIHEMSLPIDVEFISTWADSDKIRDWNPFGKTPVLDLDDGFSVVDPWVIREHLELLVPGRLLPSAGLERTQALTACATVQGMMEFATIIANAKRYFKDKLPEEMENLHKEDIFYGLANLNKRLVSAEFGGAEIKLLDIIAACLLDVLDFCLAGEIEWRADYPDLVAWLARISDRPAFRQTLPAQ